MAVTIQKLVNDNDWTGIAKHIDDLKSNAHSYKVACEDILFYSIQSGNKTLVDKLLYTLGVSFKECSRLNPNKMLLDAVYRINLPAVKLLLQHGCDVNFLNHNGQSPLMSTCSASLSRDTSRSLVSMLLNAGADVNLTDKDGRTSLMYACIGGYFDISQMLITANCRIMGEDSQGCNVLHHLIEAPGENVVLLNTILRTGGFSLMDRVARTGACPLHLAVVMGKTGYIKALLNAGCNANGPSEVSPTPLFCAVLKGETEVAELLITHGASVEPSPVHRGEILRCAIIADNYHLVSILIDAGADCNALNAMESTSLHVVVGHSNSRITQLLLDAGCDPNCRSQDGATAVEMAAIRGNLEILAMLLKAGGGFTYKDGCAYANPDLQLAPLFGYGDPLGAVELIRLACGSPICFLQIQRKIHNGKFNGKSLTVDLNDLKLLLGRILTLKELSRVTIRRTLLTPKPEFIQELPLPSSLVNYVGLMDRETSSSNTYSDDDSDQELVQEDIIIPRRATSNFQHFQL